MFSAPSCPYWLREEQPGYGGESHSQMLEKLSPRSFRMNIKRCFLRFLTDIVVHIHKERHGDVHVYTMSLAYSSPCALIISVARAF